jgi:hypothetical protein
MEFVLFIIIGAIVYIYLKRRKNNSVLSPDWIRDFVVYHVAGLFAMEPVGNMPDGVSALIRNEFSGDLEVVLLGSLQNYSQYRFKRRTSVRDLPAVREFAKGFLRVELDTLNSSSALIRFIKRMHESEGTTISDEALKAEYAEIKQQIASDDNIARSLRAMLLRDWIEDYFERLHDKPILAYIAGMNDKF